MAVKSPPDAVIEVAGQQGGDEPACNDEAPKAAGTTVTPNGAGPVSRPLRNPTPQTTSATMSAAGALNATRHGLGSGSRAEIERLAGAVEIRHPLRR